MARILQFSCLLWRAESRNRNGLESFKALFSSWTTPDGIKIRGSSLANIASPTTNHPKFMVGFNLWAIIKPFWGPSLNPSPLVLPKSPDCFQPRDGNCILSLLHHRTEERASADDLDIRDCEICLRENQKIVRPGSSIIPLQKKQEAQILISLPFHSN